MLTGSASDVLGHPNYRDVQWTFHYILKVIYKCCIIVIYKCCIIIITKLV